MEELLKQGYIVKELSWSLKLLYKPYDEGKSGFCAEVFRFESGEDYSRILKVWALWDGVRSYDFYTKGESTSRWELFIPSEYISEVFSEISKLETLFCGTDLDFEEHL